MREMWTGKPAKERDDKAFPSCHHLLTGRCIHLGDGGEANAYAWLFGDVDRTNASEGERLPCSGRGTCTTDLRVCGSGASDESATPCCSCQFGFAGVGCTELDVR